MGHLKTLNLCPDLVLVPPRLNFHKWKSLGLCLWLGSFFNLLASMKSRAIWNIFLSISSGSILARSPVTQRLISSYSALPFHLRLPCQLAVRQSLRFCCSFLLRQIPRDWPPFLGASAFVCLLRAYHLMPDFLPFIARHVAILGSARWNLNRCLIQYLMS